VFCQTSDAQLAKGEDVEKYAWLQTYKIDWPEVINLWTKPVLHLNPFYK